MKTIKENKISVVLILFFAIFGVIYLSNIELGVQGDGNEYILQTVAFQNHLSFGVTEKDLQQAKEEFYTIADSLETEYFNSAHMHLYKNARYSNHYGSYSALVVPVKILVELLGVYSLWAFPITNFILWIAALLVVLFCLKTDAIKKVCIITLAIFNPIFHYLAWTHSEVYIFSFVIIGLVFFYNREYGKSIFFLCIAAMQNVGVLPFAMMVGIDLMVGKILEYKEIHKNFQFIGFMKEYALKIIPYGLCYVPGMIPIVSTFIKFRTVSLVADVAMEHKYISHKFLDYLFDLNLGIFPYEPIVLLLFLVFVCIGLKKCIRTTIINACGCFGMLYLVSNQIQINCGMQGIMRYNVWIFPTLFFFVVMNYDRIIPRFNKKFFLGLCFIQSLFTIFMLRYTSIGSGTYFYLEFAPWTKAVMNVVPNLYNPSHGIFYSRTLGQELYYNDKPVAYVTEDGEIRKILLSKEAEEKFYSDAWTLYDINGKIVDKKELNTVTIDEGDYKYINTTKEIYHANVYELEDTIYFYSENFNADKYVQYGISNAENWGTWTDEKELVMLMYIDENVSTINAHMGIAATFYQPQTVQVLVNDELVYESVISGEQDISFSFQKKDSNLVRMKILLPDAIRPRDVTDSEDERELGLGLLNMTLSSLETATMSEYPESGVIYFDATNYNASEYVQSGLSDVEEVATWTEGTEFLMTFMFSKKKDKNTLRMDIDLNAVINNEQWISVIVNEKEVFSGLVINGESVMSFLIPCSDDGRYIMKMDIPNAVSPKQLGMSLDDRMLGLMIKSIKLN